MYDIYDIDLNVMVLENESFDVASAIMHGLSIDEKKNLHLIERGKK